jgi:hypothetical protein
MEIHNSLQAAVGQDIQIGSPVGSNQSFQTVAEQAGTQSTMSVFNFYGDRIEPTNPVLSRVMITIATREITDKLTEGLGDYEARDKRTWDWLRAQSFNVNVEIGVEENNRNHRVNALLNTQTGALAFDGKEITLPVNPVNAIKSAIDNGDKHLMEAAEKAIWDFVNETPETFIGG